MMKIILCFILSLFTTYESLAQLSCKIDSIILYTTDSIPSKYRDGGLRFYDNIMKYGPFISVSGKLYNKSERDSIMKVFVWNSNMIFGHWSRELTYYTEFSYGDNHYRSEYYFNDIYAMPKISFSKCLKFGRTEYYVLCGGKETDFWFGSHFLYNTTLFPRKKNEWDFLTIEQLDYLDIIAKELVSEGRIGVNIEVCDIRN